MSSRNRLSRINFIYPTLILVCLITVLSGCERHPTSCGPSAPIEHTSLVDIVPLIGDEHRIREPEPSPERLVIDDESVEGWRSPSEGLLRFPCFIDSGAHLSLRLRVVIDREFATGSLTTEISLYDKITGVRETPTEIFSTTPEQLQNLVNSWMEVDIPIDWYTHGSCEIRFQTSGPLASDPDVWTFWGEPKIYYPDRRTGKNILLIGVDTLRSDYLSPYGADPEITPNLTKLAESSTLFTRVWAQSPWTFPSFASIITGDYPSTAGATGYLETILPSAVTIAEILRENGYATGLVCGNPWLGHDNSGFHQGMDSLWFQLDAKAVDAVGKAKEFIERSEDRDWFCFLHFQDPHSDYTPPLEFADKFRDPSYNGQYMTRFEDWDQWRLYLNTPSDEDIEQVRNLYRGEIAYMDQQVGELLDWLESEGRLDDTLVIFSADHGEEFFETGMFGHGHDQGETSVRVPLIIRGDDFPENTRIDTPVANLDIVPTILSYLDIQVPDRLPGTPLLDIINSEDTDDRIILGEECYDNAQRFAVSWPYKCVLDAETSHVELYDLSEDIYELNDISLEFPDLTDDLARKIITGIIPRKPVFIIYFIGNPTDEISRWSGTLSLPDGIDNFHAYSFSDLDTVELEENSINFEVLSNTSGSKTQKILVIYPSRGSYTMEIGIRKNNGPPGESFYPYGTSDPDPTGAASVTIGEIPWPANLPVDYTNMSTAVYVIGIPGLDPEEIEGMEFSGLDDEAKEQLRALGYLN